MTGASLATGKLPPGFTLEDGVIAGTPIEAGAWSVAVQFNGVICAGERHPPQLVEVTIVTAR
jgi:hypothetical protein